MNTKWARFWFYRIFYWLLGERLQRAWRWGEYEHGMTGNGTSKLDREPDFPKPWLPRFLRREIDRELDIVADLKRGALRDSCIEVLGEDPDDWYSA